MKKKQNDIFINSIKGVTPIKKNNKLEKSIPAINENISSINCMVFAQKLLGTKESKLKLVNEITNSKEKKLKLVNEVKDSKEKLNDIPQSTEKIILEAEKYLKK